MAQGFTGQLNDFRPIRSTSTYGELKAGQMFLFDKNVRNWYEKLETGYKREYLSQVNPDTNPAAIVYIS